MKNPLIAKLEHGAELSDDDRATLEKAISQVRPIGAREDFIHEGDKPDYVHVIGEGFACRYKMLAGGERHIMAWLVPGDLCDLHIAILGEMDHAIGTLASSKIAYLPRDVVEELTSRHPTINRALWWATLARGLDRAYQSRPPGTADEWADCAPEQASDHSRCRGAQGIRRIQSQLPSPEEWAQNEGGRSCGGGRKAGA